MEDGNADVREAIRATYARAAQGSQCGCGGGCCSPKDAAGVAEIALKAGYSPKDIEGSPEGANLGLGCGNPQAIAGLTPGEVVVDLGSGGGFDCFLAARQVGEEGRVIGVDMTPEMIEKARRNARSFPLANVEFRLGEIEHLPVADGTADALISNCVVNLSTDKAQVFREAHRVLKPGGRLAIQDIVALAEIPDRLRRDMDLRASCVSGAEQVARLDAMLREAGFSRVAISPNRESSRMMADMFPGLDLGGLVASASITAVKKESRSS